MKKYIIALLLLIGIASAYTPEQQNILDGVRISFQMGAAYQQAKQGIDIADFNKLVDEYNAWISKTFGDDASLLMQKMTSTIPADLSKPYLASNNTSSKGIVHAIDGSSGKYGPSYTTNDINLMPESAISAYKSQDTLVDENGVSRPGTRNMGDGYLGGI